jgi:hypothetical protein
MDKRRRTDNTSKEKGQITQWTKEGQISHQKKKDR